MEERIDWMPRDVVTVCDLIAAGYCVDGVMSAVRSHNIIACEWSRTKETRIAAYRDGYGYGYGDGYGYGYGYGYGDGDGDGYGYGYGDGYGDGYGYGYGDGDGDGDFTNNESE